MPSTVQIMGSRDRPDDQMEQLLGDGWPAFITADHVVMEDIGTVRQFFADLDAQVHPAGVAKAWPTSS